MLNEVTRNLVNAYMSYLEFMRACADVTCAIIGGEGCLFIYSCNTRRISFEINSNSKEIRRAEHEYINKQPLQLAFN